MNACRGEDEQITLEVVEYWNEGICNVNGLELVFSTKIISQATHLPNVGIEVRRAGRVNNLATRDKFFQTYM